MTSATIGLGGLPPEILHRIVVAGSYEVLSGLMTVNKTFYSLCHDPLMYRSLIRGRERPKGFDWEPPQLSIFDSAEFWSVWARADFLASRVTRSTKPYDFCRWGLHLLLTDHPICQTLEVSILWDMIGLTLTRHPFGAGISRNIWRIRALGDSSCILFMLVLCLSVRYLSFHPGWDDETQKAFRGSQTDAPYHGQLSDAFGVIQGGVLCWDDHFSHCEPDNLAIICASLGIIELSAAFRRRERMTLYPRGVPFHHPSASDIPIWPLTRLEMPFMDTGHPISYLKKMTSAAYLEEEEWVGYYTYYAVQHDIPPPMEQIRFRVTEDDDPHIMTVSASGIDSVGTFDLEGKVFKRSGRAVLTKQYLWHSWRWSAAFTPFGIVGKWGDHGEVRSEGWFWIWRKSWTPKG